MGHIPGLQCDPGRDGAPVVWSDEVIDTESEILGVTLLSLNCIFLLQRSPKSYGSIKRVSDGK